MPHSIVSVSSVGIARPSTSSFRTSSIASTRPSPRIATGERKNRRRIARGFPAGSRSAYSRRWSTLRRTVGGAASSSAALAGSSSRSRRSTSTSAPASSPSSPDLDRRPRGLHRPTTTHDEDLADACGVDRVDRGVGRVCRRELLRREGEHPGDVEGDVAVPDHDGPLVREVELEPLEVGVAVVPGDECRRRPRAGELLAGDAELPVGLRAHRVDDRVVALGELVVRHVAAELDVPEEAEPVVARDLLERARDGLDVRVVGCNTQPYEAPRRRKPVDQVDRDLRLFAREERAGRIEARGAGADDGDATRSWHGADPREEVSDRSRTADGQCEQPLPQPPTAVPSGSSSPSSTWNEWPQPQEETAFGLSILNPDSCNPVQDSRSWRPGGTARCRDRRRS